MDSESVEITTVSLENSIGSVGGMTIGNLEVVDHQRLSGAGYCFSASAPPFVASAATAALRIIGKTGSKSNSAVRNLQKNVKQLYGGLSKIKNIEIHSSELSPILFVSLKKKNSTEKLEEIVNGFRKEGVLIISTGGHVREHLKLVPEPRIRISVNALHTSTHIETIVDLFQQLA